MSGETILSCLSNSISRFIHLVSSRALKNMPCRKDYVDVVNALKLFKPILDSVAGDDYVHVDETLRKDTEELDVAVNEAREFVEKWGSHMSKICGVVQSRKLIVKICSTSIEICRTICTLSESSSSLSTSTSAEIQHCIQEFQSLKPETTSEKIDEALKCIQQGLVLLPERLIEVIELFGLSSSQELIKESIAVEKENKADQPDHIAILVSRIRDTMIKFESFNIINGVPVPSYFLCPLSLELMFDPVIVATGQTYERGSIQKWLNHGLTMCPVTRQTLSHTNLIPNYTVKALIANWRDKNHIAHLGEYESIGRSLKICDSTSSSNLEDGNGFERRNFDKPDHSSPEESCSHSRSESISSTDFQHNVSSNKHGNLRELSGDMASDCQSTSEKQYLSLNGENRSCPQSVSLPLDLSSNDLITTSHIEKLVNDLKSPSNSAQTSASAELRYLAKHNTENRVLIGQCGAVEPLLSLLHSTVKLTQEHAVTALLNLSINGNIKLRIAEAGAIEPLINVLETGNMCAKENAAAALFSLSVLEGYRIKIGKSRAVKSLVDLLGSGTLRGKKDSATALFNLSIFHENKARIIQAGAVKYLVALLDPGTEMVDKAVALLSNLSTVSEGCLAIAREGGIPLLVEVVETGSQRGKENAASVLLQLCLMSPKYCRLVLQEGAVPPLVALSQSGTPRAKEKAQQLLSHFRNQRENATGRGKS